MNCPDDKQLIEFLESGDSTILIEHLSDCERCQERLESFAGDPIVRSDQTLHGDTLETAPERLAKGPLQWDSEQSTEVPGLIGDYRIVRKIGQGGMGTVLECEDLKLNRRVAIKTIRSEFVTPQVLNRLEREARNQASLNHPGIVSLYELGSSAGWPFLVMELVRGRTLRDMIRNFPLAPNQAASVIAQVARALDYAHSQGVLHRDLKPSNILIAETIAPPDFTKATTASSDSAFLVPKLSGSGPAD
jgi:serine/threonine protein kinase